MTSEPKRVHPIALILFLYQSIKGSIFPLIVLFFGLLKTLSLVYLIEIVVGLLVLVLAVTFLNYWTFTYQILPSEIIIRNGIFVKKVNHVPFDRIQNVTSNQWFFLKPFGLEELEIETAGHSEKPEVSLKAVPTTLRTKINHLRNHSEEIEEVKHQDNSYAISTGELWKYSATSPAFFSGLLAVFALYGNFQNMIDKQITAGVSNRLAHLNIFLMIFLAILVLVIFYLVSVFKLFVQYYHFQLVEESGQLKMSRGFFKTIKTNISMKRIQAIVIRQPLLRSALKIATIQLVIVSNSSEGDTEEDIVVMPVINVSEIDAFFQRFFPQVPVEKISVQAQKKTYFYKFRNATPFALVTVALLVWLLKFSPWICGILIVLGLLFWYVPAYLSAKRSKVKLSGSLLVMQSNSLMTKEVAYIPKTSIQMLEKKESIWLEKKHLSAIDLSVRSGNSERNFAISYQPVADISAVKEWYKKES